jgi:hypothetical protein
VPQPLPPVETFENLGLENFACATSAAAAKTSLPSPFLPSLLFSFHLGRIQPKENRKSEMVREKRKRGERKRGKRVVAEQ